MKILPEDALAMRLDYMRPLHPPPEAKPDTWCIPFEYGANAKTGTRISMHLAKQIAAELLMHVAQAEARELRHALDAEKKRSEQLCSEYSKASDARCDAIAELAELKRKIRASKARARKNGKRGR